MNRIQELENLINKHNNLYWIDNNPEITDIEFDKLEHELRELDPNNNILNKIHSIIPVINTNRKKIKHETQMLSLDKVYTIPELITWCKKVSRDENELFIIQPKYDGCSAEYANYVLSTRGDDGINGIDITDKIQYITIESRGTPQPLKMYPYNIKGEIIIKKSVFKKYKSRLLRKNGDEYKIERGAVIGLLMQDIISSKIYNSNVLTFITYNAIEMIQTLTTLSTMSWEFLIEEVKSNDYPTDGLVIKLFDENYSNSLGCTDHHPRGQIALKYGNPKGESKLLNVIWQIGKTKLTPVGIINPIILAGAEINRVNLHNAKFILEKDIKINDILLIERSGEIIPHVISRSAELNRIDIFIDVCPSCNSNLTYLEPELICDNLNCSGKNIRLLLESIKRIDLENIGEPTLEKLALLGITTLYQFLTLTKETISNLPGFADVSINNLFNEIQKRLNTKIEDWKFLAALNIPGVGRSLCKKILYNLSLYDLGSMSINELCEIPDVGLSRAIEIKKCMSTRIEEINELLSILSIQSKSETEIIKKIKICFTGKSEYPRNHLIKIAETKNYEVLNTVSQTLDILITNDINSNSTKTAIARKYNIKIITYDDFMKLTT
jgi:DNA ligase (NAD+)